ncbi:MAG: ABC transporter [Treponema sp. CETP13]|nr:MAG: ABC transporter [Treponema sp. CETP13]
MENNELINSIDEGHTWLLTGPNGGGKAKKLEQFAETFSAASIAAKKAKPGNAVSVVSLEVAAKLIKEERDEDEGDYVESGKDIGRTAGAFIAEVLPELQRDSFTKVNKHGKAVHGLVSESQFSKMQDFPEVKLCGIGYLLNRGIKYLSTGEIRRTLLCRALLSGCRMLILSDPFAGLDTASRKILFDFFSDIAAKHGEGVPHILLSLERYVEVPDAVDHVIAYEHGIESFCGTRTDYEAYLSKKNESTRLQREQARKDFIKELMSLENESGQKLYAGRTMFGLEPQTLIEMNNVNVGWDDKKVLKNLTWKLESGEHTLLRGPNGSGKTTLLELITGDNMQVFANDVSLFGRRRGTGETIWQLKAKMGIVSYRLHIEYRMVGGTDLEAVILSGFHDSIGLYEQRSPVEQIAAKKWLHLAGFAGREHESFSSLSYGEQRAILIIRAAVKCPPLLILDEPCHGLDEENRIKILALLETIAATGTTTLLHVTHDPTEFLDCEHHVVQLQPGKDPMYQLQTR